MKTNSNRPADGHPRFLGTCLTLCVVLAFSALCFAQKENAPVTSQRRSAGEEVPLLHDAMKLTVKADIIPARSKELNGIPLVQKGAIKVTLTLKNSGSEPVRWSSLTSDKLKNSEVILVADGKKEYAPVAERAMFDKSSYRTFAAGSFGLLSAYSTESGGETEIVIIFSLPKNISSAAIKVRHFKPGAGGSPLFPEEGVLIGLNLQDKEQPEDFGGGPLRYEDRSAAHGGHRPPGGRN